MLPVPNSPPQPSVTQTPCPSYPQFLPSRQFASLVWRNMTTPALVSAVQCWRWLSADTQLTTDETIVCTEAVCATRLGAQQRIFHNMAGIPGNLMFPSFSPWETPHLNMGMHRVTPKRSNVMSRVFRAFLGQLRFVEVIILRVSFGVIFNTGPLSVTWWIETPSATDAAPCMAPPFASPVLGAAEPCPSKSQPEFTKLLKAF